MTSGAPRSDHYSVDYMTSGAPRTEHYQIASNKLGLLRLERTMNLLCH